MAVWLRRGSLKAQGSPEFVSEGLGVGERIVAVVGLVEGVGGHGLHPWFPLVNLGGRGLVALVERSR